MGSLHKSGKRKKWYAAYYLPDGRRAFRSTGTSDRKKATAVLAKLEEAAELGKERRLTMQAARNLIADIYQTAARGTLEHKTLKDFAANWLEARSIEVAQSSLVEYERVMDGFLTAAGEDADRPIDAIGPDVVQGWIEKEARRIGASSCNRNLKIVRALFAQAHRMGMIPSNPAKAVQPIKKKKGMVKRRAFTVEEVGQILQDCDPEWAAVVLTGVYCGQRLGDIIRLKWSQVDLVKGWIHFRQRKTDEEVKARIKGALHDALVALPSSDDPEAAVFPTLYDLQVSTVSRKFGEILAAAGVGGRTADDDHKATKSGRDARRTVHEKSFHSLRHLSATLLHDAGAGQHIAKAMLGHRSDIVHDAYVTATDQAMARAVDAMPDVTRKGEGK